MPNIRSDEALAVAVVSAIHRGDIKGRNWKWMLMDSPFLQNNVGSEPA